MKGRSVPAGTARLHVPGTHRKWYRAVRSEPWALPSWFLSPRFVQFSSWRPGVTPPRAGSLAWAMLSLTDTLDFSESGGNFVLGKTGRVCPSQRKGERPGHRPHNGEEAEFVWFLKEHLAPQIGRAHRNPIQRYWSLFGDFGGN